MGGRKGSSAGHAVRLTDRVVELARLVAADRGRPIGDVIGEAALPTLEEAYDRMIGERYQARRGRGGEHPSGEETPASSLPERGRTAAPARGGPHVVRDAPCEPPGPRRGTRKGETAAAILACSRANPSWNQSEIATHIGCSTSTVSRTFAKDRAAEAAEAEGG
jgi:hypothetical protein